MRWKARPAVTCLTFALVGVHHHVASASPADLFGYGPRSQSLAGAGVSSELGPAAAYTNPAMLAAFPARRVSLGLHSAQFLMDPSGDLPPEGDAHLGQFNDDADAIQFGLATPLDLPDPLSDRIGFGLAASTATHSIARVRILNESRPQFPFLGPRAEALNLSVGLGVRLPYDVHVGVGTLVLATLSGSVDVDGGGEDGSLKNITDDELELVAAPTFGVAFARDDGPSFGVVYRSELRSNVDLLVTVRNLGALTIPPMHVNGIAQVDPAQLAGEYSHAIAGWRLIAGATYRKWSSVSSFKAPTVQCPTAETSADPGAETAAESTDPSDEVTPLVDCTPPQGTQLRLRNTLTPRFAVERTLRVHSAAQASLRAGYFYEPSPLPSGVQPHRIMDNPRHVLSAGYEIALDHPLPALRVALAVQWHHLVERDFQVEIPPPIDPVASLQGTAPELPPERESLTSRGQIWSLGIATELEF